MKIIPAIDIRGGKVVRLVQGLAERQTVYSDSPADMAKVWEAYGVELIHVVDLDGAMEGKPKNISAVRDIVKAVKAKIELGGGIRDEATIKSVLDIGVDKVVIGTRALDKGFLNVIAKKYGQRIVAGLDASQGLVYTRGWLSKTKVNVLDLVKDIEKSEIKTINYTDISKDGTLEGPNIDSIKNLLRQTKLSVVAGGGISTLEDIKKLKALEKDGLNGIIIGKALYEGKINLKEAIDIC